MEKRDFKEYIYMGMTAVSVIAVCILLWFSIQHWDVVSAGTRKVVKILAPILCGAVLTYLTAPAYNWVAGIVEKTLGSVTKNSKYVRGAARMLATAACLGLVIVLVVGMFQLMIPQLIESLIGIQDSFPLYVQNVYEWIQRILKNNPEIENMVLSSFENNLAVFQNWAEKSFTNIDMHRTDRDRPFQQRAGCPGIYQKLADRSDCHGVSAKYQRYTGSTGKEDCLWLPESKTGESGNRGAPVYQSDVRRLHHRQAGGFPHYRYYLFHRCDDLKYAVPDAFERHYRCDECDTFFWTVHRCDTCSVPGILSQSAPVCVFPHLDSASAAV